MGTLHSSFQRMSEVGRHRELENPQLPALGASGRASLLWGKKTLPEYLINCSSCSLLSMREWLAWIQTHLISFAPLGTSHISLPQGYVLP